MSYPIHDLLQQYPFLKQEDLDVLAIHTRTRSLEKGTYFIREGAICKEVAFVRSGTFRSYYISSTGEETTYCILFPGNFMTAYSSFITQEPSREYMQAITPAELLVIPKTIVDELERTNIRWLQFLKVMAEQQYIELEKRIFLLQQEKAAQRYQEMLLHHPEYLLQIPLQYLASYLGISTRHLSRLRKEMTIRTNVR